MKIIKRKNFGFNLMYRTICIVVATVLLASFSACDKKDDDGDDDKPITPVIPAGVVLEENFNTGTLPANWKVLDVDGDSYTWDASFLYGQEPGLGYNGSAGFISSASYINDVGPLTPDNWLITPKVKLNGKAELTFYVTAQDANYSQEHYGVYVSTTTTDPSAFTLVFEETFNGSKGLNVAQKTNIRGEAKAQAPWVKKTIALTGFKEDCYVAIRHFDCTDMFYLNLDDLKIENK